MFAHKDGGQAEILADPNLLFSNTNEAVERILRVLEQPALQATLRTQLSDRARIFSAQNFVRDVQTLVEGSVSAYQESSLHVVCGTS